MALAVKAPETGHFWTLFVPKDTIPSSALVSKMTGLVRKVTGLAFPITGLVSKISALAFSMTGLVSKISALVISTNELAFPMTGLVREISALAFSTTEFARKITGLAFWTTGLVSGDVIFSRTTPTARRKTRRFFAERRSPTRCISIFLQPAGPEAGAPIRCD